MELVTLELGGFRGSYEGGFDLILEPSLLANSCLFLVIWQELARISSILEPTVVAK